MTCPNFCEGIPLFRARLALALVFAAILLTNSIDAQSVQNTVELSVTDGRPVAAAVQELVSRYRYVITYEDPRRVYQDDLEDVTTQVRKDLYKYPPGKAPKVIVPSDATLTLSIPSSSVITAQDMGSILEQLMQAQASTGRGGHFRVERAGEVFHVMPTEVRDRNGNWIAQPSILDVHISLPMEDRSTGGMINAICNAVSTAVHIQVGLTFGVGGYLRPIAATTVSFGSRQ